MDPRLARLTTRRLLKAAMVAALVFGGDILLVYFEPLRLYVAAAGVLLAGWAVIGEWRRSADPEPTAYRPIAP